jgi:hypothetical protein
MGTVSAATLDQLSTSTSLPVGPSAGTGYVAELSYPGVHQVTDPTDAGGWCRPQAALCLYAVAPALATLETAGERPHVPLAL